MNKNILASRREVLRKVLRERFGNNQRRMAEAVGKSPTYINFLICDPMLPHHKNLGEKLARDFEKKLNLPDGSLVFPKNDGADLPLMSISGVSQNYIEIKRCFAQAFNGTFIQVLEEGAPPLNFPRKWIQRESLDPDHLVLIYAGNESMEPRIHNGDMLMIDTAFTALSDGKVYAICIGDEIVIKRVFRKFDSVILRSDNQKYEDDLLTIDQANRLIVVGRVVWLSGGI